ncbi:MAG: hypothetical protein ACR2NM_09350 [Bythopirellula sp.]
MIRTFLEYLLSRALDNKKPPSPWLQRRLQQDEQLQQFHHESKQLDTLFRQSAAQLREGMQAEDAVATLTLPPQPLATTAPPDAAHRVSVRWLGGLAAAALLLIALLPNWLQPSAPPVHAGEFSQQLTVVPGEVLRLLSSAAEVSRTQVTQLSPLANLSLTPASAWPDVSLPDNSPVRQEWDNWQDRWLDLRSRLPSVTPES